VKAEHPAALRFILQEDIYLLQSDQAGLQAVPAAMLSEDKPDVPVIVPPSEVKQPAPVTQAPAPTTIKETPAQAYNYLGENKKHFLILTHYSNDDFIAADHLAALQNILKRKDYEIEDIAILNLAKAASKGILDLISHFKPEKLLILGEAAVPAGMGMPPLNQPKKMKNGVLLRSFSFDEMMNSTDNKKAFWDQMKNL
jgi:hypothetical protein